MSSTRLLHYLKTSSKIRMVRSLIAGGAAGVYLSEKKDRESQEYTKNLEEQETYRTKLYGKNEALYRKHANVIIEQAFKDVGFKGKLYIEIDPTFSFNPLSAMATYFNNSSGQPAAYVRFIAPHTKTLHDYNVLYRDIYAISGHEAIHVTHNHRLSEAIAWACVGFTPILGYLFFDQIHRVIKKTNEIDADLTSAWKLGTANQRTNLFVRHIEEDKALQKMYEDEGRIKFKPLKSDNHPSHETRLAYYQLASKVMGEPEFFKSEKFHAILRERQELHESMEEENSNTYYSFK